MKLFKFRRFYFSGNSVTSNTSKTKKEKVLTYTDLSNLKKISISKKSEVEEEKSVGFPRLNVSLFVFS